MQEECGLFGIAGLAQAAKATKLGLFELQHRGQESCGIATSNGQIHCEVRMGLVMQSLDPNALETLPGKLSIGHTRYSTAGSSELKNAQPFVVDCKYGRIAVAHNGNFTNASALKQQLQNQGATFQSNSDTEVVLQLIARSRRRHLIDAITDALNKIEGAFCLLFLASNSVIAVRDPHGFRPLAIGLLPEGGYVFASETCAFRHSGAEHIGNVKPGEIVVATPNSLTRKMFAQTVRMPSQCLFEMVYFSRPNSSIFGRDVYQSRFWSGELLADEDGGLKADVVIGVPDSGVIAAQGYSYRSGIPLRSGLTRNHYTGRSFIQPTEGQRRTAVNLKLATVDSVLKNQRVIVVDDSLVRGTTARQIIAMVRKAGAVEVHWRLGSSSIKYPCYYGVDIPDRHELIAVGRSELEIAKEIGADSVRYLSLESLLRSAGGRHRGYCRGCITGNHPTFVQIS